MDQHEVSHTAIYERLIKVEGKVDRVEQNTEQVVAAFNAAAGAFVVLEWLAKLAKPLLWLVAFGAATAALWDKFKFKL